MLRSVDVPVVSNAECNKDYFAVTEKNPILDEQVCAGVHKGGLDSCQGDSGGPLVAMINNQPFLFGVVSWGIGASGTRSSHPPPSVVSGEADVAVGCVVASSGCARADIPGVYTRVLSHSNWVTSKMMLTVRPKSTTPAFHGPGPRC